MHVFGHCLNHDKPKSNAWAHHNCLNIVCCEWTQAQRPVIELFLVWKPKIVSWIILSPILEPITWAHQRCIRMINIKGQNFTRYMPFKCKVKPFQANTKWSFDSSLQSASPSLKHPKWTKKKQVAQLCLTPHLVCNIMVKLKVCLFIPCFYVSLNSNFSSSI